MEKQIRKLTKILETIFRGRDVSSAVMNELLSGEDLTQGRTPRIIYSSAGCDPVVRSCCCLPTEAAGTPVRETRALNQVGMADGMEQLDDQEHTDQFPGRKNPW